jgi:hypothetical protein
MVIIPQLTNTNLTLRNGGILYIKFQEDGKIFYYYCFNI